jgi:hypothetical protein
MVRQIRDAHYEQLRGKSPEERIAFYRAKARSLQEQIATQQQTEAANELQPRVQSTGRHFARALVWTPIAYWYIVDS